MSRAVDNDQILKSYLLGEMLVEESDRIEREYLEDKDILDQLLAVEDDLVDEYVRDELSDREREEFEQKLLSTPRQLERVQQARLLSESLRKTRLQIASKPNTFRATSWSGSFEFPRILALAAGVVAILALCGFAWLFMSERQLRAELRRVQAERAQIELKQQELQTKLVAEQREKAEILQQLQSRPEPTGSSGTDAEPPAVAMFVLALTSTRSGEGKPFTVKKGVDVVRLQIPIASFDYKLYQAELQTADGISLYRSAHLEPREMSQGKALLVSFPARILKARDYVLKVSGVTQGGQLQDAGFFSFRLNLD